MLNRRIMFILLLCWLIPKSFWAKALSTAVYLRNRSPTKAVEGKTPYEVIHGEKPKVGHLRVFGCTAYSHISKDERRKLDANAQKCIFLGYPINRKGYRLYDQRNCKVIHNCDVKFNEFFRGVDYRDVRKFLRGDQLFKW